MSDIFNCSKKFIAVFEIQAIKVGDLNWFLMEGANQKCKKKDYFIKTLSSLSFLTNLLQVLTESPL